jgi:hypothetical protein
MPFPTARRAASVLAAVCLLCTSQVAGQDSSAVPRPADSTIAGGPDSVRAPAITGAQAGPVAREAPVPLDTLPLVRRPISPGGMALKANSELDYMREIDSPSIDAKSQEREDWLVIVGVNHLIAGIEAYVSAYLWDFPGDLQMRPTPYGTAATVSVPFRVR